MIKLPDLSSVKLPSRALQPLRTQGTYGFAVKLGTHSRRRLAIWFCHRRRANNVDGLGTAIHGWTKAGAGAGMDVGDVIALAEGVYGNVSHLVVTMGLGQLKGIANGMVPKLGLIESCEGMNVAGIAMLTQPHVSTEEPVKDKPLYYNGTDTRFELARLIWAQVNGGLNLGGLAEAVTLHDLRTGQHTKHMASAIEGLARQYNNVERLLEILEREDVGIHVPL